MSNQNIVDIGKITTIVRSIHHLFGAWNGADIGLFGIANWMRKLRLIWFYQLSQKPVCFRQRYFLPNPFWPILPTPETPGVTQFENHEPLGTNVVGTNVVVDSRR